MKKKIGINLLLCASFVWENGLHLKELAKQKTIDG